MCAGPASPYLGLGKYGFQVMAAAGLLHIVIWALMIVGVVLILVAQGNYIRVIVLCAVFMLAPCGNMFVLLLINMSVTRTLRRAGLRVGFLGVDPDEAERILDPELCNGCGYNLTGNVSGICSECGRPIEAPDASA